MYFSKEIRNRSRFLSSFRCNVKSSTVLYNPFVPDHGPGPGPRDSQYEHPITMVAQLNSNVNLSQKNNQSIYPKNIYCKVSGYSLLTALRITVILIRSNSNTVDLIAGISILRCIAMATPFQSRSLVSQQNTRKVVTVSAVYDALSLIHTWPHMATLHTQTVTTPVQPT